MRTMTLLSALIAGCSGGPDAPTEKRAFKAYSAGITAAKRDAPERAEEHFTEALSLSSEFPQAWLGRARAREILGLHDKAESDYLRSVETAPEEKKALYMYHHGRYKQRLGQHDLSLPHFNRAVALHEKWPDDRYTLLTLMHRGLALLRIERYDEAIEDFDKVLSRNPDATTREEVQLLRKQALKNRK